MLPRGHPSNQHTGSRIQPPLLGRSQCKPHVILIGGICAPLAARRVRLESATASAASSTAMLFSFTACDRSSTVECDAGAIQAVLSWRQARKLRNRLSAVFRYPLLRLITNLALRAVVPDNLRSAQGVAVMMTGRRLEYEFLTGRKRSGLMRRMREAAGHRSSAAAPALKPFSSFRHAFSLRVPRNYCKWTANAMPGLEHHFILSRRSNLARIWTRYTLEANMAAI